MSTGKTGVWRKKHIGRKTSIILSSVIIGLLTALAAVLLKNGVKFIADWINMITVNQQLHFLLFIFPTIGIILTVIYTQFFRKGDLGRGITNVIYSISRKDSAVEKDKLYSQLLTSILTVGFGGSAGLEAPIVSTGAAIGSQTSQWLLFDKKERTLLLACGAAAGISAIFNAPIAGVVFAFEILLVDMPLLVAVPVLIASASASLLSRLIYSGQPFIPLTETWHSYHLVFYVILGFIAAVLSVYAIRIYFFIGDLFIRNNKPYQNALIGGLLLGTLIFFFPLLYGEGYDSVVGLLHQNFVAVGSANKLLTATGPWNIVIITFILCLLKVVGTSLTVGAGGNGGMFGSSLFMGAMLGYSFSHTVNLLGFGNLNEVNFTVIGMAAMMAGIVHAPLTAIFLIAEITGGYVLFVPLMIVTSVAFMGSRYFEPFSVYTKKLALKGDMININKDKLVLSKMLLSQYLEKDFIPVKLNDNLGVLVKAIENSKRNIFPVVNDVGELVGIILLDNVRTLIFSRELYESTFIKDLMIQPSAIIDINEGMEEVLKKLDELNVWNLPVTDKNKYVGFVSKSKIFTQYRRNLIKDSVIPA